MEFEYKSELPEDFQQLCDIFQVQPTAVVKSILDKISFPFFYSHINETGRWPTFLFLELLDENFDEKEMEFNEPYLERINDAVKANLRGGIGTPETKSKTEKAIRNVMREWHKNLAKARAKYLLDNLPNEDRLE